MTIENGQVADANEVLEMFQIQGVNHIINVLENQEMKPMKNMGWADLVYGSKYTTDGIGYTGVIDASNTTAVKMNQDSGAVVCAGAGNIVLSQASAGDTYNQQFQGMRFRQVGTNFMAMVVVEVGDDIDYVYWNAAYAQQGTGEIDNGSFIL